MFKNKDDIKTARIVLNKKDFDNEGKIGSDQDDTSINHKESFDSDRLSENSINQNKKILEDTLMAMEDTAAEKRKGGNYMHVLEVREQIRLLWKYNAKIMNLMFGNLECNARTLANNKKGYSLRKFNPDNFFWKLFL